MTPIIMMIHGMWGSSWYWGNYKQLFESKGYRCITPTLRLHDMDPSSKPPPELGTSSLLDYGFMSKNAHYPGNTAMNSHCTP